MPKNKKPNAFKSLLKSILWMGFALCFIFMLFVTFIIEDVMDDFTETEAYVYTTIEACEKDGHENKICLNKLAEADKLDASYHWNFSEGWQCALMYGADQCFMKNDNYLVKGVGFGWANDDRKTAFPVYRIKDNSLVAANSYPVREGTFEISGGDEYLTNLSLHLPLYTPVCVGSRFKANRVAFDKYSRSTVLKKIKSKSYYNYRVLSTLLEEDSDSCRLVFGLIEGEIK